MLSRRGVLAGVGALSLAGCSPKVREAIGFAQRMVAIQKRHGGQIGVSALTGAQGDGGNISIESDQRFAHCSTFKWVLAAAILQQVDQGKLSLSKEIAYSDKDVLSYAPVTRAHVAKGRMAVADLCAAAVELSDNTAANLLLPLVGGPAGLTQFARGLGDAVTRFDRNEPELNSNLPGDQRDTTTPAAMAGLLRTVFTGTALKPDSLTRLKGWMVDCQTGKARIRAGVPAGSVVADKTGTGANGAVNDVAVIWPPKGGPVFLAIYTSGGNLDDAGREKTIADITRLVFDTLGFISKLDSSSS
ncbi:MAG: class A beta-lactamase [Asticcacaulis sp.]|uniref:class A beta-lactamase n=1 Tax=Asticcacaulis sp. TaxID=1872648 RepID=UPI003F7C3890